MPHELVILIKPKPWYHLTGCGIQLPNWPANIDKAHVHKRESCVVLSPARQALELFAKMVHPRVDLFQGMKADVHCCRG